MTQRSRSSTHPGRPGVAREISKALGVRLRTLRKAEGLTMVELAQRSGVNIATISRIERGRRPGPLRVYLKLAAALGLRLAEFVDGIEDEAAGNTAHPVRPHHVSVCDAQPYALRLLTTNVLTKKLLPVLLILPPGGRTPAETARLGTERFLYLVQGSVAVTVGNAAYPLASGQGLYLDASVSHGMTNVGRSPAQCLSVLTPPML